MKVFINPGHMPGVDPGAVNPVSGLRECDVALAVGKLVEYYLKNAGCEVMRLQSDNLNGESSAYPNVCQTANDWGADVFVSLHCNALTATQEALKHWCLTLVGRPNDWLLVCISNLLILSRV